MTKGYRETNGAPRRGQSEIIAEILRSAANGIGKTQMMYRTMINYDQVRRYSSLLLASGMLRWDASSREFRATDKALEFLREYDGFTRAREETERRAERLERFLAADDVVR